MKIKNTFLVGLISALAVVATDFVNAYVTGGTFSFNGLYVALGIAAVGYAGQFLTGNTNTNIATIGAALMAIVPLLSTGKIDWKMVLAVFIIKVLGLATAGTSVAQTKPPTQ